MAKPYSQIFEFFLNERIYARRRKVKASFFGRNLLVRIWRSSESLLGNLYKSVRYRPTFNPELAGKPWVVVSTRNQESSIGFLAEEEHYKLVAANFYEAAGTAAAVDWYPRPKIWYYFHYAPFFMRSFWRNPVHWLRVFPSLFHGMGAYENHLSVLRRYRPAAVVVSNDHLPWFRALTLAARKLDIPTVYLQHAPVVDDFPSLISDLSLLDGQDALDKYRAGGKPVAGRVALVGMPKYDPFHARINAGTRLERLGIPYGFFDDVGVVVDVARHLRATFPELTITLRKHPRDERPLPVDQLPGIVLSDARREPALDYLVAQDVIVASDSGIHLEAVLLNVTSLYYSFTDGNSPPTDHYGFLRRGLVPNVKNTDELTARLSGLLQDRPPVRAAAAYYVAHLNGAWAGRSQALVRREVEALLARH